MKTPYLIKVMDLGDHGLNNYALNQATIKFSVNVLLHWLIRYFEIRNHDLVYWFGSGKSMASLFLPIAFIMPFIITTDTVKKATQHARKGRVNFRFPKDFRWFKFAAKVGLVNGFMSLMATWGIILVASMLLGSNYTFNHYGVILLLVVQAGILAALFTTVTMHELKNQFWD